MQLIINDKQKTDSEFISTNDIDSSQAKKKGTEFYRLFLIKSFLTLSCLIPLGACVLKVTY